VVAVLVTREQAENAARALQSVGFAEDDVVLLHGQDDLATIKHKESLFAHLTRALETVTADAGRRLYMDALAEGRSVLLVYAPDEQAVERATTTLERHGAHHMQAFRRWYIEDLPEHLPLNP
jgi:hypothetical protein